MSDPTKEEIAEAAALLDEQMSGGTMVSAETSLAIILKRDREAVRADPQGYNLRLKAAAHAINTRLAKFTKAWSAGDYGTDELEAEGGARRARGDCVIADPDSKDDAPGAIAASVRVLSDLLESVTEDWVREENLAVDLAAGAERLIESLPKCTQKIEDEHGLESACPNAATRAYARGGERFCDDCADREYTMASAMDENWKPVPEYPRAEPLRAMVALLEKNK